MALARNTHRVLDRIRLEIYAEPLRSRRRLEYSNQKLGPAATDIDHESAEIRRQETDHPQKGGRPQCLRR